MTDHGPVVRFENAVRDGIARETFPESRGRKPRDGEIGGILLGRQTAGEILVEDFEPVLCEHRFGGSLIFSDEDLNGIEETVQWFRKTPNGTLEVLGFYRTQDQPDFSWNEHDELVMRRFFPYTGSLLLLLKPLPGRNVAAEFYVLDEGKLRPAADAAPFPLDEPVEIALLPTEVQPANLAPDPIVEAPAFEAVQESVMEPAVETPRLVEEPVRAAPPFSPPPSRSGRETRPSENQAHLPPPTRPRRLEEEEAPDRSWVWVLALVALTLVGAVLGYRSVKPETPKPANSDQHGAVSRPPAAAVPKTEPLPSPPGPAAAVESPKPIVVPPVAPAASPSVEQGIQHAIQKWQRAIRSGDPDLIAACYAPQLDRYFGQRHASSAKVRRATLRSVKHYGRPAILRVSGLSIMPVSDDRAIATFRKHWQTAGPKVFAGEGQERMALVRLRDDWKIASEEETKVYWTQRPR
ncbi:MAG TPA: hypothetical protein VGH38_09045 [Bryobacteraceae bacterium]|jgi:hypothetical protein